MGMTSFMEFMICDLFTGGTNLTISGTGLSAAKMILIDGRNCMLFNKGDSEIHCLVPKKQGSPGDVDVIAITPVVNVTSPTKLTYTAESANKASVTGVTPSTASVWGKCRNWRFFDIVRNVNKKKMFSIL